MRQAISLDTLQKLGKQFDGSANGKLAMNAVTKSGIAAVSVDSDVKRRMRYAFSVELKTGKVTSQNASGRCWMFAALNTMRTRVMEKLNLETFELSQNYPLFYDKLERANYFFENILETLSEPLDSRTVAFLLSGPMGDGGQWDMFASLVTKYGVAPKDQMPETYHSSNTGMMRKFLTIKLRQYACELRESYAAGASVERLRARKDDMLRDIYHILCVCLGRPPERFTFEVRDKDGAFIRDTSITPVEFFKKYVDMDFSQYVSLINAPTGDKPFGRTYTVKFLGNVKGGQPVKYLNLPVEDLKAAAIKQMQSGQPVWFGSDVGQWLLGDWGCMDTGAFDFDAVLGSSVSMTKAQRLDYGESVMTHAMVFQGVNLDENGKPDRWKVENSWGDKAGNEGWYIMSDPWFDEYTYQVLVDKRFLTEEQRGMWEQDPIELKPWDPMGSLALTGV